METTPWCPLVSGPVVLDAVGQPVTTRQEGGQRPHRPRADTPPPATSPPRALCVQTSSAHSSLASLEEEWALAARPARAPWGTGGTPQAVPKERDLQESEEK